MSDTPENPRAFPLSVNDTGDAGYEGMTLHDYFAAHAPITFRDACVYHGEDVTYEQAMTTLAKMRMAYATMMLASRLELTKERKVA